MDNNNKKLYGQFYTTSNPFHNQLFLKWFNGIDGSRKEVLLEPFAGANNIVKMINDLSYNNDWACFDIQPNNSINAMSQYLIQQNDSILSYPVGHKIAITNPPYLAKNSASKSGLYFPDTSFDDLYKYSLDVMLNNTDYIAAIIPESFITQNIFHDRLFGVATLSCRMFEDTDCPVCLAMFMPSSEKGKRGLSENDFHCYKGNVNIGLYSVLKEEKNGFQNILNDINWKFNIPKGEIGLYAIDGTINKSIRFVDGNDIPEQKIKVSSRGVTRIQGAPNGLCINDLLKEANLVLSEFRDKTNDIFLTSFRGLRKDGDYRRRLDFSMAKNILNLSISRLSGELHA